MKKIAIVTPVLLVGVAMAQTQSYSGSTIGGPTWDRPIGAGPSISGLGPVAYHAETVSLIAGTYDIYSDQDFDGYLHLYADSFNPADQLTNLLAGNDDGAGGVGTSEIFGAAVAGGTYIVVTSGYQAGDQGNFSNRIVLVPTPASAALLGLGGVVALRRRR